ncbi:MAG: hypothetical protein OIF51_10650 [Cellvibrionaceae bacterium]|nr:hypothetical protein [Cellvibrionaceae bacterium]
MNILRIILIAIVAIVSAAAGLAKIMRAPQELEFLQGFGLSVSQIVTFGAIQLAGALLLVWPRARALGAVFAIAGFALSSFFIFKSGNVQFGLFSMLPIMLAFIVLWQAKANFSKLKINN